MARIITYGAFSLPPGEGADDCQVVRRLPPLRASVRLLMISVVDFPVHPSAACSHNQSTDRACTPGWLAGFALSHWPSCVRNPNPVMGLSVRILSKRFSPIYMEVSE